MAGEECQEYQRKGVQDGSETKNVVRDGDCRDGGGRVEDVTI